LVRRIFVVAAGALALVATPPARAGGVPMELARVGSQLWTVSDVGLEAVDTRTGRVAAGPQTPYP